MRYLALAAVLIGLVSCGAVQPDRLLSPTPPAGLTPGPNAVPWRVANGITACGIVRAYVPATATSAGSLTIGTRTYPIAPGTAGAGSNGFPPKVDSAMCVWGGLGGTAAVAPNADPLGPYRCGRVRDYVASTASASGHVRILEYWSDGELDLVVPPGTALSALRFDDYRCFTVDAPNPSGDAVTTGRDTRLADADLACGQVRSYAPATATTPGAITVGSRTFGIPAGITYQMDPAGARSDPIAPGVVLCLRGQLDDAGAIARYGPVRVFGAPGPTGQFSGGMTGRVVAFKAPTASADGFVALALNGVPFRIPAGTTLTAKADAYMRTYDLGLDAQGDMIATGDKDEPPVRL